MVFAEPGVARFDLGVGSPPGVRGGVVVLCTSVRLPLFAGEGEVSIGVELRPCAFVEGDTCNGPGSVAVRWRDGVCWRWAWIWAIPVTRLARSRSFPFGVWWWEGVLGAGTALGLAGVEFVRVDPATLDPRGAPRLVLLMLLAVLMAVASNLRGKLTGGADMRFLVVPVGGPEPDILNLLGFAATRGTATGVSWGAWAAGVERMASTMEAILEGLWMRTVSEPLCSDAIECARGLREAIQTLTTLML